MQQIRCPDQSIALPGVKELRLDVGGPDHPFPDVMVGLLGDRTPAPPNPQSYLLIVKNGPAMRARIVFERTRTFADIFQRDPDAAHETLRDRRERHTVRRKRLLRPDREFQGLKRPGSPAIEPAEQLQNLGVGRNRAHIGVEHPPILDRMPTRQPPARQPSKSKRSWSARLILSARASI